MKLSDLGFDRWFLEKQEELQKPEYYIARVTAVDREACLIRNETNEVPAELAGRLMFSAETSMDFPCVGDHVIGRSQVLTTFLDGFLWMIRNIQAWKYDERYFEKQMRIDC